MTVQKREAHMRDDTRIALLESAIDNINKTLERIERNMDKRFSEADNKMDKGFSDVDKKIDKINDCMWSNFKWLLGMMIGGFVSMSGVMAHALHWF